MTEFTTTDGCTVTLMETPEGDTMMQMKVEPNAKAGLTTATVFSAPEGREEILGRYASVRLTSKDRAALRSALDEEDSNYVRLVTRQGDLLTATVKALRGDPPELVWWSHHDVAELAQAAVQTIARILAKPLEWWNVKPENQEYYLAQAREMVVARMGDQGDPGELGDPIGPDDVKGGRTF